MKNIKNIYKLKMEYAGWPKLNLIRVQYNPSGNLRDH